MRALETEARALARVQGLPAAAVGGRYGGCVTTGQGHVPAAADIGGLRKIERYDPAADRGSAAVGDHYVYLVRGRLITGNRGRTRVGGECLTAQQQAGKQQAKSQKNFHCMYPLFKVL